MVSKQLKDKLMTNLSPNSNSNRNNSSFTPNDFKHDNLEIKKKVTIDIPCNKISESSHKIKPDSNNFFSLKNKRKKLISSRIPRNNLNLNYSCNSNHSNNHKRIKKSDIAIAEVDQNIFNLDNNDQLINNDGLDNIMKEFDIDEIEQKSQDLKNQLNSYKRSIEEKEKEENNKRVKNSITSKYLSNTLKNNTLLNIENSFDSNTSDKIDLFHKENKINNSKNTNNNNNNNSNSNQIRDITIDSLVNNRDKSAQIIEKYSKQRQYIKKDLIKSIDDIKKIINDYKNILIDILNGKVGSFFYNEAKKIQQSSPLMSIKDNELHNLSKDKYFGYIGAIRGFHISKIIENDLIIGNILKDKLKYSKVIQFWGVDNFTQYVLTPEIIARIIMKEGKFKDLDDAYDEMEATNDFGMFVTDKIDILGKDSIGNVEDLGLDVKLVGEIEEIQKNYKSENPIKQYDADTKSDSITQLDSDDDDDDDNDIKEDKSLIGDIFG